MCPTGIAWLLGRVTLGIEKQIMLSLLIDYRELHAQVWCIAFWLWICLFVAFFAKYLHSTAWAWVGCLDVGDRCLSKGLSKGIQHIWLASWHMTYSWSTTFLGSSWRVSRTPCHHPQRHWMFMFSYLNPTCPDFCRTGGSGGDLMKCNPIT